MKALKSALRYLPFFVFMTIFTFYLGVSIGVTDPDAVFEYVHPKFGDWPTFIFFAPHVALESFLDKDILLATGALLGIVVVPWALFHLLTFVTYIIFAAPLKLMFGIEREPPWRHFWKKFEARARARRGL